jgi:hypothetical protein
MFRIVLPVPNDLSFMGLSGVELNRTAETESHPDRIEAEYNTFYAGHLAQTKAIIKNQNSMLGDVCHWDIVRQSVSERRCENYQITRLNHRDLSVTPIAKTALDAMASLSLEPTRSSADQNLNFDWSQTIKMLDELKAKEVCLTASERVDINYSFVYMLHAESLNLLINQDIKPLATLVDYVTQFYKAHRETHYPCSAFKSGIDTTLEYAESAITLDLEDKPDFARLRPDLASLRDQINQVARKLYEIPKFTPDDVAKLLEGENK